MTTGGVRKIERTVGLRASVCPNPFVARRSEAGGVEIANRDEVAFLVEAF